METPWALVGIADAGMLTRLPVGVERSETVKKSSGKGRRHAVAPKGSQPPCSVDPSWSETTLEPSLAPLTTPRPTTSTMSTAADATIEGAGGRRVPLRRGGREPCRSADL